MSAANWPKWLNNTEVSDRPVWLRQFRYDGCGRYCFHRIPSIHCLGLVRLTDHFVVEIDDEDEVGAVAGEEYSWAGLTCPPMWRYSLRTAHTDSSNRHYKERR